MKRRPPRWLACPPRLREVYPPPPPPPPPPREWGAAPPPPRRPREWGADPPLPSPPVGWGAGGRRPHLLAEGSGVKRRPPHRPLPSPRAGAPWAESLVPRRPLPSPPVGAPPEALPAEPPLRPRRHRGGYRSSGWELSRNSPVLRWEDPAPCRSPGSWPARPRSARLPQQPPASAPRGLRPSPRPGDPPALRMPWAGGYPPA